MTKVGFGGTLHMYLENQMSGALNNNCYHDFPRTYIMHMVKVESGTYLADILEEIVTCIKGLGHHVVNDIPSAQNPVVYTVDGLVEKFVLSNHSFGIGVEWCPE